MNILAIETATDYCSVALMKHDGNQVDYTVSGRGIHSEAVFFGIAEVLEKSGTLASQLDAVLLSGGPGSYTGLRVGYSAVKGFLFGHESRLYIVDTMLSIAAGITSKLSDRTDIHIVLDARRNHLIHQMFTLHDTVLTVSAATQIIPLDEIKSRLKPGDALAGTGLERIESTALNGVQVFRNFPVRAEYLLRLWMMKEENPHLQLIKQADPATVEPAYLTPGV